MTTMAERFRELHDATEIFVMPNPWDIGSARLLASLGFPALATTSSGHAATLGRHDQSVTRDEMLDHAAAIAAAVDVPINIDSERCFADDPQGVAETVALIAATGAAGCSIEDYDPGSGEIDPIGHAVDRVAAAAEAAHRGPNRLVLTARAENHIYGIDDLDDTVARLAAYRDAGADVVYPTGLTDLDQISVVVHDIGVPVNILASPGTPPVGALAAVGVRRVSTGGALAWAAYGAAAAAARELAVKGTSTPTATAFSPVDRAAAFD